MLSNAARPTLSRLILLLLIAALVAGIALAGAGCSAAPSRGWSGPVISNNILYVGTLQGKILALDLTTAVSDEPVPLWDPKTVVGPVGGGGFMCAAPIAMPMGMYGTPVVNNERIYIGAYDGNVLWVATNGEAISDPKFKTGGPIVGSVAIEGDTLFVGSSDGRLYAIGLDLKAEKWHFKTGGKIWSTPVVSNGVVYITSADHHLYAIDAESGKEIWRFKAGAAIMSTPLVANGRVYVGGCDRKFYAIRAATEDERLAAANGASPATREFDHVFAEAGNWFWTQALLHNGEIWVGCLDHNVYVLDAETLEEIRRYPTGGMVYTPPVLLDGQVIVGSQDGRIYVMNPEDKDADALVYAIDPATLEVVESPNKLKKTLPPILAPMFADQTSGILYFHAQNRTHTLYAFKLSTKEVLWTFRTDRISS